MKKICSLLVLCATVVFASCSKDDPVTEPVPEGITVTTYDALLDALQTGGTSADAPTLITLGGNITIPAGGDYDTPRAVVRGRLGRVRDHRQTHGQPDDRGIRRTDLEPHAGDGHRVDRRRHPHADRGAGHRRRVRAAARLRRLTLATVRRT